MSNWGSGYITGLVIGLTIGVVTVRGAKRKPWKELDKKGKKLRVILIISGGILVLTGLATLFIVNSNIAK